mmetsp:Transcript_12801/g.28148  ORF Transcript_12801/g.28148 Transcript_12801/m.28148 type:complete len:253 (-) Transcript_12801:33-791(-)|eukprot:CAMPEP_0168733566 /NCGR_PEP_ID=MMETSP0724-20121128/8360_1 /TAXON_ID=265536 /ORGANISM="Amphiprora sp., Strain CCMP467" /LENGTH=252 /DNA_ID=CAMNT_0008780635 /DNA_START=64 /DNA_END=822 /DNA_ORIENTATION=-
MPLRLFTRSCSLRGRFSADEDGSSNSDSSATFSVFRSGSKRNLGKKAQQQQTIGEERSSSAAASKSKKRVRFERCVTFHESEVTKTEAKDLWYGLEDFEKEKNNVRQTMKEIDDAETSLDGAPYHYREILERVQVACQFANIDNRSLKVVLQKHMAKLHKAEAEETDSDLCCFGLLPTKCHKDGRIRHMEMLDRVLGLQENAAVIQATLSSRRKRRQEEVTEEKIRIASESITLPSRKFAIQVAEIQTAMIC